MTDEREWLGTQLCAALHALSLDAVEALAMQQPNERRAAQLALTFGNAVLDMVAQPSSSISQTLLNELNELAALLSRMSTQPGDLWTDNAVHDHPAWAEVRMRARTALTDLGVHREGAQMN